MTCACARLAAYGLRCRACAWAEEALPDFEAGKPERVWRARPAWGRGPIAPLWTPASGGRRRGRLEEKRLP